MKHGFPLSRLSILVAVAVLLAGCASTPSSRFYTLSSLVSPGTKKPSREAGNQVSVSIASVEIPDYLDRPQIVTLEGRNELKLAEFDRWAGSLSDNISAVLADNLSTLLGSDRVYVNHRLGAEKANYLVALRVLQLDCLPGDHVFLKAQWALVAGQETKDVATHVSTFTEKLEDSRYDTLAAAVSRTIEQVSREIAREISQKTPPPLLRSSPPG